MTRNKKAFFWTVFDKIGIQSFTFVIGIFLARLLTPFDYGVVGLSTIFISLTDILIESGFSNALVRKQDRNQTDLSTAFYFNISISLLLYILLFFASPYIASFFDTPLLSSVLRVVGINLIINSWCVVQNALFIAEFRLKILAYINIASLIPSSLVAISLAFYGYGVYALVIQSVLSNFIRFILLWFYANWHPSLVFSKKSFDYLWGFGSKLILSRFIGVLFNKINTFIIGKYIGKSDLGFYSKAESLSSQPDSIVSGVISKVAVPIMSECQHDKHSLLNCFRKYSKLFTFVLCYFCGVLFLIAQPLIIFLWTAKWTETIVIFRILLLASILSPLSALNLILLQVLNRTDMSLKLEIIKKTLYIPIVLLGAFYGLIGLSLAQIAISVVATIVNSFASKKYIEYSYVKQFCDVLSYMIPMSISIAVPYMLVNGWIDNNIISIIIGIVSYTLVFFLLLFVTRDQLFLEYFESIQSLVLNRIKK